jgi:hypothetical protein
MPAQRNRPTRQREKGCLRRVLGIAHIVQDAAADPQHQPGVTPHQQLERLPAARRPEVCKQFTIRRISEFAHHRSSSSGGGLRSSIMSPMAGKNLRKNLRQFAEAPSALLFGKMARHGPRVRSGPRARPAGV